MRRAATLVAVTCFLGSGCRGSGGNILPTGPSPVMTAVEVHYQLAEVSSRAADGCVGPIGLHPSWWGFARTNMIRVETGHWGARFEDVPIGQRSVRFTVPDACAGAMITVNGTPLEALTFTVHSDGSVTP